MKYRRDIDGLRSLAIVPVILFHLNFSKVGGGFLGVDIFFVISGFLITSLVNKEVLAGRFSIVRFYERRVLRIFPALFAVLFFCLVMGYFYLLPHEFQKLADSVVATALFGSNILFFLQDNYFNSASSFKPLLHTWSLAVEEQFYLLFPLFLILAGRFRNRRLTFWMTVAIAVASFAFNVWALRNNTAEAFYLPMARAWELLGGALLAYDFIPPLKSRRARELLGVCGAVLIAGSVVFLNEGGNPLCPVAFWACLGAALLIYTGDHGETLVSRLLGNPVLVYIGKISYSLYLWHWPLLVFYRLQVNSDLHFREKILLLAAAFAAAALSTRFVERPFRSHSTPSARAVLRPAFGVIALFVAVGLSIDLTGGAEARFPARVSKIASFLQYGDLASFRTDSCFLSTNSNDFRFYAEDECLGRDPKRKNFLILGDSHAAQLWSGLTAAYPQINFLQATVAGCAPLIDARSAGPFNRTCQALMSFVFKQYLPHHKLDGVIMAARWEESTIQGLGKTLDYVKEYEPNVVIVGPSVEYALPLPRVLAFSILDDDPGILKKAEIIPTVDWDERLRGIAAEAGVTYISMRNTLCDGQVCAALTPDDVPIEFDNNHLSQAGARYVAERWQAEGLLKVR